MAKKPDPYAILGVDHDADEAAIKKAFRGKALDNHPDHGGTEETFALVTLAKEVLTDSKRRAKFDETGDIDEVQPDTKDAAAMNMITGFINSVIDSPQVDALTTDLIALVVHHMEEQISGIKDKIAQLKKPLAKCEKIQKKFKKKGAGPNLISRLLEQRIEGTKQVISKLESEVPTHQRAIELIREYEFDFDKPQPTNQQDYFAQQVLVSGFNNSFFTRRG